MGCCGASTGCIKKCAGVLLFAVALMMGLSFWIFGLMGTIKDSILCLFDGLNEITALSPDGTFTMPIPASALSTVETGIGLLQILSIIPGIVALVFALMAVFLACKAKESFCCAKFFVFLLIIILLISFILYAICGAIGIVMNTPMVAGQLEFIYELCEETLPEFQDAVSTAQEALDEAIAAGIDLSAEQAELDKAEDGLDLMAKMCACISSLISGLTGLVGPGICCAAFGLIAFIVNLVFCCNMGCCKTPADCAGSKTAPA